MSNENPFGPSPKALATIKKYKNNIHCYPSWIPETLKEKCAIYNNVSPHNISVSAGSYELINLITSFFVGEDEEIITFDNTFMAYKYSAKRNGRKCTIVKMSGHHYDLNDLVPLCNKKTKAIFFANPNNPTGTFINHLSLRKLLISIPNNIFVISDEAYIEYVTDGSYPNSVELQKEFPNLIILRTFSKIYGLAGIRIGYGIASKDVVEKLDQVRLLRSVNALAEKAGEAAIEDVDYVNLSAKHNAIERDKLFTELTELGFNVVPSQANFLYIPFNNNHDKDKVVQALAEQGLIVCDLTIFGHDKSIRISIGTQDANLRVIDCLSKIN